MTHLIHFSRQSNTASAPSFEGFGGDYQHQGADPYFAIARQMLDVGEPDGPAVFIDQRGMACLTVRSLHACARRYKPNEADTAARQARIKARENHTIAST